MERPAQGHTISQWPGHRKLRFPGAAAQGNGIEWGLLTQVYGKTEETPRLSQLLGDSVNGFSTAAQEPEPRGDPMGQPGAWGQSFHCPSGGSSVSSPTSCWNLPPLPSTHPVSPLLPAPSPKFPPHLHLVPQQLPLRPCICPGPPTGSEKCHLATECLPFLLCKTGHLSLWTGFVNHGRPAEFTGLSKSLASTMSCPGHNRCSHFLGPYHTYTLSRRYPTLSSEPTK